MIMGWWVACLLHSMFDAFEVCLVSACMVYVWCMMISYGYPFLYLIYLDPGCISFGHIQSIP